MLQEKLREATADIEAYAKSTGQFTDWLHIKYANSEQNPLAKYGADNGEFLYSTAKKYDASEVFLDLGRWCVQALGFGVRCRPG
ncbi:hypothetical protein B0T14DRAFT_519504 [Immersiella caudata]|uniref:Uncharacterized protein n=1 Tax=Immersiella caudata TaxID=314043 RepID=A0AA39WQ71_9PEZI|nr:hypothetical protein B0T14DRAFT_519504 [Immersiella caudata]